MCESKTNDNIVLIPDFLARIGAIMGRIRKLFKN
jgi:hypothetical protein